MIGTTMRTATAVSGMINAPIIPGTLAVRVSGFYQQTPGYIDNPSRNEQDINEVTQLGGRLALGWTPTTNLDVTLEAMRQEIDSELVSGDS